MGGHMMNELRFKKVSGIELNRGNLPTICEKILQINNVRNVKVDKDKEFLEIFNEDKSKKFKFKFGDGINITNEWVWLSDNNKEYIAYWLRGTKEWLPRLDFSTNVSSFTVYDSLAGRLVNVHINDGSEITCTTKRGVIVFDDVGDFVEMFEDNDHLMLDGAMKAQGYTKVEEVK